MNQLSLSRLHRLLLNDGSGVSDCVGCFSFESATA